MKSFKISISSMFLAVLALTFVATGCKKEEGCTDAAAVNFDPRAEKDDGSCQYSNENVISDDGSGVGTTTWTKDKVYILDGFVFVNSGQTLTIEAGTVIKGRPGSGANASALVVARGGKIMAEGTASEPIIFTAEQDDVTDAIDIPAGQRGLWGGVIILGNAGLNSVPGETQIEGIPLTEPRGLYGGSDNADNSGIFRYVSIRYGGTEIGAGNEINGLTLGGVGSGTTIEYVEVFNNLDDGIEFFGGTVNTKYMVAAFCGDDAFDYDEGYRGKGQFWFVLNDADDGDRGGEHDGGTNPEDGSPFATPNVWNATYIGRGESEGKRAITFRDNAGGQYHNSVFVDWGKGVDVELLSSGEHSYARYQAGDLMLSNNVFWNVAGNVESDIFRISVGTGVDPVDSTAAEAEIQGYFNTAGNSVVDPGLTIVRTPVGGLSPIPTNGAVSSGATPPTDTWFTPATYKGAFGTTNWLTGWTALDFNGYF